MPGTKPAASDHKAGSRGADKGVGVGGLRRLRRPNPIGAMGFVAEADDD